MLPNSTIDGSKEKARRPPGLRESSHFSRKAEHPETSVVACSFLLEPRFVDAALQGLYFVAVVLQDARKMVESQIAAAYSRSTKSSSMKTAVTHGLVLNCSWIPKADGVIV